MLEEARRKVDIARAAPAVLKRRSKLGIVIPAWRRKHAAASKKQHAPLRSHTFWAEHLREQFPMYLTMPSRDKELLDRQGVGFPDKRWRVCNTSQSECQMHSEYMTAYTPGGSYWSTRHGRKVHGGEGFSFQALPFGWKGDSLLTNFSTRELQDLAGNAFNGTACLEMMMVQCATLGLLIRERQKRHCITSSIETLLFETDIETDDEQEAPLHYSCHRGLP